MAAAVPTTHVLPLNASSGRFGPYAVFVILIAATIPWRSKVYYQGGADPVVLTKAILSLFALGLAGAICLNRIRHPVRSGPVVFLLAFLACTVLGGWGAGALIPSMVLAVRVILLAATVLVLASCFRAEPLVGSLMAALATYCAVASVTGLAALEDGRLRGAFPPTHPNELALMASLIVLWCLWKTFTGQDEWIHVLGAVAGVGVLVATGSRTSLAAMPLGALVLLVHASAVKRRTVFLGVLAAPVFLWLLGGTGLVRDLALRGGGTQGLTTLSNRTIAWQAALSPKDSPWLEWLGGGLALKRIQVAGQWWNEQILDSSWISALVQGGLIGLGVCVLWLCYSLVSTVDSSRNLRGLQLALLVYLATRGLLESGLFDASLALLALVTVTLTIPLGGAAPRSANPAANSRGSIGLEPVSRWRSQTLVEQRMTPRGR